MSPVSTKCKLLAGVMPLRPSKKYLRYLASPEWGKRRRQHLASTGYWCEICHAAPSTQVHHWTYENLGDEPPHDLCGVCVKCHWRIHRSVMAPFAANDNDQFIFTFIENEDEQRQAKHN